MAKELFLLADKIRHIREQAGITQAELARKLGLTRSSVNSWDVIELAKLFDVSTDYLLGLERGATISVEGLSDKEVSVLLELISCFREHRDA